MIKKMEYECKRIEDIVLDLADEIKNGWRIYRLGPYEMRCGCIGQTDMTVEVMLKKEG